MCIVASWCIHRMPASQLDQNTSNLKRISEYMELKHLVQKTEFLCFEQEAKDHCLLSGLQGDLVLKNATDEL